MELGRRLQQVSADASPFGYVIQRLWLVVQRGNTASVPGSAGSLDAQDFFFEKLLFYVASINLCLYLFIHIYFMSLVYCVQQLKYFQYIYILTETKKKTWQKKEIMQYISCVS